MDAISIVNYMHELKEAGFSDRQAEVQAKKMEQVIQEVREEVKQDIKVKDLVSKSDLRELELCLIKWIMGTMGAGVLAIAGLLLKYMH
jgi:hypothetical protein